MIAQHLALDHPERVRSLALCCTHPGGRRPERRPWRMLASIALRPSLARAGRSGSSRRSSTRSGRASSAATAWRTTCACARRTSRPRTRRRPGAAIVRHDSRERLGELRMPVLVVHGEEDRLVSVESGRELARLIPHAELRIVPNAGHLLVTDAEERPSARCSNSSLQAPENRWRRRQAAGSVAPAAGPNPVTTQLAAFPGSHPQDFEGTWRRCNTKMATGTVKWFNDERAMDSSRPTTAAAICSCITPASTATASRRCVRPARCRYEEEESDKGPRQSTSRSSRFFEGRRAARNRPGGLPVGRGLARGRQDRDGGEVTEALPNTMFRVKLDNGHEGARPHLGQDAPPLHPHPARRSREDRAVALRPGSRAHHVPAQVASGAPRGGRGAGFPVWLGALPTLAVCRAAPRGGSCGRPPQPTSGANLLTYPPERKPPTHPEHRTASVSERARWGPCPSPSSRRSAPLPASSGAPAEALGTPAAAGGLRLEVVVPPASGRFRNDADGLLRCQPGHQPPVRTAACSTDSLSSTRSASPPGASARPAAPPCGRMSSDSQPVARRSASGGNLRGP